LCIGSYWRQAIQRLFKKPFVEGVSLPMVDATRPLGNRPSSALAGRGSLSAHRSQYVIDRPRLIFVVVALGTESCRVSVEGGQLAELLLGHIDGGQAQFPKRNHVPPTQRHNPIEVAARIDPENGKAVLLRHEGRLESDSRPRTGRPLHGAHPNRTA
jgi:hypothetical protein